MNYFNISEVYNTMYTLEDSTAYKILKTRDADFWVGDIQRVFTMISPLINEICVGFDNYTLHNIDHPLLLCLMKLNYIVSTQRV